MLLNGKRGLVIGVANDHSIAAGCAQEMAADGARLALTYLNDKAKPYAEPTAERVNAEGFLPLDVTDEATSDTVFSWIAENWGGLDFLVHSVAYCPKDDLHAPVSECSRDGFLMAMDISCHSFIRLARRAAELMSNGGSLLTVSYYGAEKVVDNYNVMGPVKAALESSVRYLAHDLGARNIRVNAISPGPIATRAASGIAYFDRLLDEAAARSPKKNLATIGDAGALAAFLASDRAAAITGGVHYVDCGYNVMS